MQPLIVTAGLITVSATSTADIPISVALFAPADGAFRKRIARIRVLRPGDTKTMSAELAQGAYEMACGTEGARVTQAAYRDLGRAAPEGCPGALQPSCYPRVT